MKHRIGGIVVVIVSASLLVGCSYLQSYFPDKERDYQYTAEIPMINYPADLRKNQPTTGETGSTEPSANLDSNASSISPDTALPPAADSALSDSRTDAAIQSEPEVSATEVTPANNADEHDAVSSVDIIKYDDGESRLRLGAGFSKSWRVVNKALSRNTIEVTERNHEQAHIAIQYDPDEKNVKDDSFIDEINFFLKGIDINDKAYVLKLEEHDQKTDVIVLNEEHLPLLNDDAALRLLKVMADTIKADIANKAKSTSSTSE